MPAPIGTFPRRSAAFNVDENEEFDWHWLY
jgi:hypothetical protein